MQLLYMSVYSRIVVLTIAQVAYGVSSAPVLNCSLYYIYILLFALCDISLPSLVHSIVPKKHLNIVVSLNFE